jgi:hypothetical protein
VKQGGWAGAREGGSMGWGVDKRKGTREANTIRVLLPGTSSPC